MFRDNVKQDVQDIDNVLCLEAMGLWELFFCVCTILSSQSSHNTTGQTMTQHYAHQFHISYSV